MSLAQTFAEGQASFALGHNGDDKNQAKKQEEEGKEEEGKEEERKEEEVRRKTVMSTASSDMTTDEVVLGYSYNCINNDYLRKQAN